MYGMVNPFEVLSLNESNLARTRWLTTGLL